MVESICAHGTMTRKRGSRVRTRGRSTWRKLAHVKRIFALPRHDRGVMLAAPTITATAPRTPDMVARWPKWPWGCIGLLAMVETVWIAVTPLRVGPAMTLMTIQLCVFAAGAFVFCDRLQRYPRLNTVFSGLAFLAVAWPVLRLFNHLTMTTALPWADDRLSSWDQAIGFDWLAYLQWADAHPVLLQMMDLTYTGLTGYSCLIFLLLSLRSEHSRRCFELIALFVLTAVACSLIGMFFPAEAAMIHFRPDPRLFTHIGPTTGTYHIVALEQLRNDPQHVFDLRDMPGLVTFPSFHTAMGVIAIYCCRGNKHVLACSILVNGVMIASTPILGSHYAIDIAAGALVAIAIILGFRRCKTAHIAQTKPVSV